LQYCAKSPFIAESRSSVLFTFSCSAVPCHNSPLTNLNVLRRSAAATGMYTEAEPSRAARYGRGVVSCACVTLPVASALGQPPDGRGRRARSPRTQSASSCLQRRAEDLAVSGERRSGRRPPNRRRQCDNPRDDGRRSRFGPCRASAVPCMHMMAAAPVSVVQRPPGCTGAPRVQQPSRCATVRQTRSFAWLSYSCRRMAWLVGALPHTHR
jgi:hypothetical protein